MEIRKFQSLVCDWFFTCFRVNNIIDLRERNHRFLEEALELVQACECTESEAHKLVEYVFSRPVGEKHQEVGGVMVSLSVLCLAHDLDIESCSHTELTRVSDPEIIDKVREKQLLKPKILP